MQPVLIYCLSLQTVGKVFCYLKAELQDNASVDRDPEHKTDSLLIGMCHSKTPPQNKTRGLSSLTEEGSCMGVVATTALGIEFKIE